MGISNELFRFECWLLQQQAPAEVWELGNAMRGMPCARESDLSPAPAVRMFLRHRASRRVRVLQLVKEARRVGSGKLGPELQQRLLDEALTGPVLRAAPMALTYQRRVLQGLLRAAEEDGCELAEDLTEMFTRAQLVRSMLWQG